jgi:hypothetical protein
LVPGIRGNATYVHVLPELVDRTTEYCDDGSTTIRSWDEFTTSWGDRQLSTDVTQLELVHLTPEGALAPAGPKSSDCGPGFILQLPHE